MRVAHYVRAGRIHKDGGRPLFSKSIRALWPTDSWTIDGRLGKFGQEVNVRGGSGHGVAFCKAADGNDGREQGEVADDETGTSLHGTQSGQNSVG